MSIDMFPRTIENRLKIGRYVPILRHQSARIEPCRDGCSVGSGEIIITAFMIIMGDGIWQRKYSGANRQGGELK